MKTLELLEQTPQEQDAELFVMLFRKLKPMMQDYRVLYDISSSAPRKDKYLIDFSEETDDQGRPVFELDVMQPSGEIWKATLPWQLHGNMTIEDAGTDWRGKKMWLVTSKKQVTESAEHDRTFMQLVNKLISKGNKVYTFWTDHEGEDFEVEVNGAVIDSTGDLRLLVSRYHKWAQSYLDDEVHIEDAHAWEITKGDDCYWVTPR